MECSITANYIGNLNYSDTIKFMKEVTTKTTPKDEDNIISFYIPIQNGETRVECINPKLVSKEDFSEAKKVLERNQEIVNEIINCDKK